MIAAIVAALVKVFYEIIKMESGTITATVEGAVPADVRARWDAWVRERTQGGAH